MIIVTHGAAAVAATYGYTKASRQKKPLSGKILARNFLLGIMPDVPLTILVLSGKFDPQVHFHHRWVTHTPAFWLIVSLFVMKFISKEAGLSLLGATWLHLATDWYGGADGIAFLYPYSTKQFGVSLTGLNGKPGFDLYVHNPVFLTLEILINCSFLCLVFSPLRKRIFKRWSRS